MKIDKSLVDQIWALMYNVSVLCIGLTCITGSFIALFLVATSNMQFLLPYVFFLCLVFSEYFYWIEPFDAALDSRSNKTSTSEIINLKIVYFISSFGVFDIVYSLAKLNIEFLTLLTWFVEGVLALTSFTFLCYVYLEFNKLKYKGRMK